MRKIKSTICITAIYLLWAAPFASARVIVDNVSANVGEVENSKAAYHTFLLRNAGDKPVKIVEAKPNCGCTVAKLAEDTIAPGSELPITVELSLKGKRGTVKQSVIVKTDDPETPQLLLSIEANAVSLFELSSDQVIFGRILAGDVAKKTIDIRSSPQASTPLSIKAVTSTPESIKTELETVEVGRAYRIHVRLDAVKPGRIAGSVRIETNLPDTGPLMVSVSGQVVGDVAVTPEEIVLTENGGQPVTRYVLVTPGKIKEFEVTSIETPTATVQVEKTSLGSGGIRLQLRNLIATSELEGKTLRLQTNLPSMEQIVIPIRVIRNQANTQPATQESSRKAP